MFGLKVNELNDRIEVSFRKKPECWKRFASALVKDRVILDITNGINFLKNKGDVEVYQVFHFEIKNLSCDFTLLRHGIMSTSKIGEPFLTYGHVHEKYKGEAYHVIKNDCFFQLSDITNYKTFFIHMKEGNSIFIHPNFLHRIISYKRDCLVFNFVPKDAGHDYNKVKNRGFPFHVIYNLEKDKISFVKNKKYSGGEFKFLDGMESENPIKIFKKSKSELIHILENPDKHRKIYFKGL
ncbi:MAG: glucose-6-phosphate isomerase family protein [Candidatus Aenigmatarchaeota archaeon]